MRSVHARWGQLNWAASAPDLAACSLWATQQLPIPVQIPIAQGLESECASHYAEQVNGVCAQCVEFVVAGGSFSPSADPHSPPSNAHLAPLSLAALTALREPRLSVLEQLQPQKRAQLAASVAAMLQQLHRELLLAPTPHGLAEAPAGEDASDQIAVVPLPSAETQVAGRGDLLACMEVLARLLQVGAQTTEKAAHGGTAAAAVRTPGFIAALAALLGPRVDVGGGSLGTATGLTPLQDLALACLEGVTRAPAGAGAAAEVSSQACGQAVEAGAVEALVPLLRIAREPQRVLRLLLSLAQGAGGAA